jgi:hypothetical protein
LFNTTVILREIRRSGCDSYDKMVDMWATKITAIKLADGNVPNHKVFLFVI